MFKQVVAKIATLAEFQGYKEGHGLCGDCEYLHDVGVLKIAGEVYLRRVGQPQWNQYCMPAKTEANGCEMAANPLGKQALGGRQRSR